MQFSQVQRQLAIQAMDDAEERTARYYCIPPYRWQQMCYDLLTRQDQEWEALPDTVLARVQYLQRSGLGQGELRSFYRIQLNDPTILTAAQRENLSSNLYPFFVYIITHEMVHLVRLSTILNDPIELLPSEECEERRVQHISHQILTGSTDFHPILERFSGAHSRFLSPLSF